MNAANWIALYAAIVGTSALAWQAVTYLFERRPKVRIDMRLLHIDKTGEKGKDLMEHPWLLMIDVVNTGKYATRIRDISIETKRNENDVTWKAKRWNLPWVLDSGEHKDVNLYSKDVGALSRGQHLRGIAITGTGIKFHSDLFEVGKPGSRESVLVSPKHADEMLEAMGDSKRPKVNELNLIGFEFDEQDIFGLADGDE